MLREAPLSAQIAVGVFVFRLKTQNKIWAPVQSGDKNCMKYSNKKYTSSWFTIWILSSY